MTNHRFCVGNLVRISSGHDLEAKKIGRITDPPENIKRHQEAHGLGRYSDHVRTDPSGALLYWVEFAPASRPGDVEAAEVEETALELLSE